MAEQPWYKTSLRWGQTNLVECDPERYDADWWREHWRRTRVQGIIVNAGGIWRDETRLLIERTQGRTSS